jgi:hypothetical protein
VLMEASIFSRDNLREWRTASPIQVLQASYSSPFLGAFERLFLTDIFETRGVGFLQLFVLGAFWQIDFLMLARRKPNVDRGSSTLPPGLRAPGV